MDERPAASFTGRDNHLDALAIEQSDRGLNGRGRKDRIDAAGQKRDPAEPSRKASRLIDDPQFHRAREREREGDNDDDSEDVA